MTKNAVTKPYTLEAIADLPSELLFGPEFLGLLRPARIGGVEVHVVLPDFTFSSDSDEFSPKLHPRLKANWLKYYSQPMYDMVPPFGEVKAWKANGEIIEFRATRLAILSKGKVTEAEALKLLHAIDGWLDLLTLWIEVVTSIDLHHDGIEVEDHGASAIIWLKKGRKGKNLRCRHPVSMTITSIKTLNISPLQWRKILMKASQGVLPPEPYIFLKDARRALNEKRYRRSVLDSATAAEVALTKLRDEALVHTQSPIAAYVQDKAQQISGLVEFNRRDGRALPKRIQQEIAEPRNKAIHEGREPDAETARLALKKGEEVVAHAFPRRHLLDL
jgi:HEPN domain-containing protein